MSSEDGKEQGIEGFNVMLSLAMIKEQFPAAEKCLRNYINTRTTEKVLEEVLDECEKCWFALDGSDLPARGVNLDDLKQIIASKREGLSTKYKIKD